MGLISRVSSRTYRKSMCDKPDFLNFLHESGQLKDTARTGWVMRKVPNYESVADHSWRMALIALTFPNLPKDVDRNLAIKMSIVHDLAEAKVGDLVTGVDTNAADKHEKEAAAMRHLCSLLPPIVSMNMHSDESLLALYSEYETRETPTAKFVKDLDRLELACQAFEYENRHKIHLTPDFYTSVRGKFFFSEVQEYFIKLERK